MMASEYYFTIYEDKNFKGKKIKRIVNANDGSVHSLKGGPLHDKMSSIKWNLPPNTKVVFYEHYDSKKYPPCFGREYEVIGIGSDPDTHNEDFKDCASCWQAIYISSDSTEFYFDAYQDKKYKCNHHKVYTSQKRFDELYSLKGTSVHDKMSSIKWNLPENAKIVFLEHDNDQEPGRTYTIRGSGSDGDIHKEGFGDCASSWKIMKNDDPAELDYYFTIYTEKNFKGKNLKVYLANAYGNQPYT